MKHLKVTLLFVLMTTMFSLIHAQNVGIGTNTPNQKLHVEGNVGIGNNAAHSEYDLIIANPIGTIPILLIDASNSTAFPNGITSGFDFKDDAGIIGALLTYDDGDIELSAQTPTGDIRLNNGGAGELNATLTAKPSGNIGIGTNDPTQKLDVDGNARFRSVPTDNTATKNVVVDANGNLGTQEITVKQQQGGVVNVGEYHNPTDEITPNSQGAFGIDPAGTNPDTSNPFTLADVHNYSEIAPGLRKSVTFPTAFTATPVVMATAMSEAGQNYPDNFAVTITNVTATGFDLIIHRVDLRNGAWGQNVQVSWMAFQN